jgi:hypothetical protein
MASSPLSPCPNCGTPASGKYCSECGASLAGATCTSCQASLTPGAQFCHKCGTPVSAASRAQPAANESGSTLPWAVAGVALAALVALVAGQRYMQSRGEPAPVLTGVPQAPAGSASGVDISSMSPEERASRLFNRVMGYAERGRADSVRIFAPMALAAYEMLGTPNLDQRYDMGRIAEVSGDAEVAAAQADTILREKPDHLLGLVLAAAAARQQQNEPKAREYFRRLTAAAPAERASKLPEYEAHANDITAALAAAPRP